MEFFPTVLLMNWVENVYFITIQKALQTSLTILLAVETPILYVY
jgi:hypothetical protein